MIYLRLQDSELVDHVDELDELDTPHLVTGPGEIRLAAFDLAAIVVVVKAAFW
jgi:hypothetical protein